MTPGGQRKGFAVLQPVGEDAQSEGLCRGQGSFPRRPVDHDPGEIGDISDPAAVDFSFQLNLKAHKQRIPHSRSDLPNPIRYNLRVSRNTP